VDCVWIHSVNESGRVVHVERTRVRYTLGSKNGHRELLAKPTIGADREEVCWCINVDHRHTKISNLRQDWIFTSIGT
jgi:hypothetical protein